MLGVFYAASAHRTGPLRMQVGGRLQQGDSPAMETANAPILDDDHLWGSFVNGASHAQPVPLDSARALAPPGSARAARIASNSELASSTVAGRGIVRPVTSSGAAALAPPGSARAARLAAAAAADAVGVVRSPADSTPAPAQLAAPSITVSGYGMSLSGYGTVQPLGGNVPPENDARALVDGAVQPLGGNGWAAEPGSLPEKQTWSSFVNGGSLQMARAPRDPVRALAPPGSARAARLAEQAAWEWEAEREAEASEAEAVAEASAVEAAAAEAEAEAQAQAEAEAQAQAQAQARPNPDLVPNPYPDPQPSP